MGDAAQMPNALEGISLDQASISVEVSAWCFRIGGFFEEKIQRNSIGFNCRLLGYSGSVILSTGENLGYLPFRLDVFGGDPIGGNGERVKDGGGGLTYVPALNADGFKLDAGIEGWAALEPAAFADLWHLLTGNNNLVFRARLVVAPVEFKMGDEWLWDVQASPSLAIRALGISAAESTWWQA